MVMHFLKNSGRALKFFYLIMLLVFCCSFESKKVVYLIAPDFSKVTSIGLKDLATEVIYIPLENKFLIGNISILKLAGNRIYTFSNAGSIQVFDIHGKYLNSICKKGGGPEEVSIIRDFTVDQIKNEIYVLDNFKVKIFSLSGKHIRTIEIPDKEHFNKIKFFDGKIFLFDFFSFGQAKYNWLDFDAFNHVGSGKLNPFKSFESNIALNTDLYFQGKDQLFYFDCLNDTIFEIRSSGYEPAYLFTKGAYRMVPDDMKSDATYRSMKAKLLRSVNKSGNYLVLNYLSFSDKKNLLCIYDEKEQKFFIVDSKPSGDLTRGIENNWDGCVPFLPITSGDYGPENYLVGWTDAYKFKAHVASDAFKNSTPKYPEKKKELEKLANSLNENDNPVLMLVKLKE